MAIDLIKRTAEEQALYEAEHDGWHNGFRAGWDTAKKDYYIRGMFTGSILALVFVLTVAYFNGSF